MTARIQHGDISVAQVWHDFIETEALPGTGVAPDVFWTGLDAIVHEFGPKNRALLARRHELQAKIDAWHLERSSQP
ncbi:MAG: malate synthase G, partial [Hyphomicrobiaceae bacterium]